MLTQAIGDMLPLAVAIAISPIPVIAVILMLGTPRARTNGPAFAVGWILGLLVVSVIVLVVASGADEADSASADGVNWFTLGFGVIFIVLAGRQWRSRPKPGEVAVMPKWMDAIDSFTPAKSFGLGIVLSAVNPKNLVLTIAAAGSIAKAGLSSADAAIAVAVFVTIASLTVVGAVLYYLVAAERAAKPLASMKAFMAEHNAAIMCVVLLVLGAKLIGSGLAGVS
jgi:threonine/homoserine/homoserine lactone efflux protein